MNGNGNGTMHTVATLTPAVAYLRRSTDRQEQSLGDQRREITRWAAEHGYDIVREYVDDAISGTSADKRPGFQQMIADAQRHEFRAVIVWNSDRFSRGDVTETEHYRYLLRKAGVTLVSVTEDYLARDGIDGDVLRTVKQFQNRQFSIGLSQTTLRGQITSVLAASDPGRPTPFGYDREVIAPDGSVIYRVRFTAGGERQVFDRNGNLQATYTKGQALAKPGKECRARLVLSAAERVAVVRDIFRMCIDGQGFKGIADELNRRGVISPRGQLWCFTSIKSLLVNPAYRGDIVWNRRTESKFYACRERRVDKMKPMAQSGRVENVPQDDWIAIENAVPAIVDRETWDLAQVMVRQRADAKGGHGKQTSRWLLSGVLRCGDCGHAYWGERKAKGHIPGRRPVISHYYTCAGRRQYGKDICRVPSHVKATDLEAWALRKLEALVFADRAGVDGAVDRFVELARAQTDAGPDTNAIERELAQVDATVTAIMANIDPANLPLLNERLTQLRRRKEHLQADLRTAKAASRDLDEKGLRRWARERIGGLADAMAGRRNEHVRRVLGTYIDEIVINPKTKTGVMRVNAGLAGLVEAGRIGVDDPALRPARANGRPQDANGRQRGANRRARNANDRPEGRSRADTLEGNALPSKTSLARQERLFRFRSARPNRTPKVRAA